MKDIPPGLDEWLRDAQCVLTTLTGVVEQQQELQVALAKEILKLGALQLLLIQRGLLSGDEITKKSEEVQQEFSLEVSFDGKYGQAKQTEREVFRSLEERLQRMKSAAHTVTNLQAKPAD